VNVIGPCLVQGAADCTVESGHRRGAPDESRLRIGWRFVRGMGDKGLEALTKARESGPFSSIGDVVRRAKLGRPDATALARAGAFSFWESDRRRAAWEALRHVGDTLPLAPPRPSIHRPRILGKTETVFLDYFSTGMSLTGHPMELLRAGAISSKDLVSTRHDERVLIAGLVVARQRPQSANGVMFVLMEDESGFINAIVRREVQATHQEIVRHSLFLLVLGKIQRDGQVIQILAERLKPIHPTAALAFKSRDFR
jgi:error-prone DNA polymerase